MRRLLWFVCVLLTATGTILYPTSAPASKKDRFYFERHGYAYWQVPTEQKVIALTFDDGPDQTYTPKIVHLLHEYGHTATFFVIGKKVTESPEVLNETVQYGNEIGNHTFSHQRVKNMSQRALTDEIRQTDEAIRDATGQCTTVFRPPRGQYDERIISTANKLGYGVVMWSWDEDTRDWQRPGVGNIVAHVLRHIHPGDIILFHDGTGNSQQTVDALRILLPKLNALGYRSVTMSELIRLRTDKDEERDVSDLK